MAKENIEIDPTLTTVYSDLFDRVFEGVFMFKPLQAPTTTEFNLIVNEVDQSESFGFEETEFAPTYDVANKILNLFNLPIKLFIYL